MKVHFKHLATFALAIGVNYSAFSQWWTAGNNAAATDYLGTNNNMPLDFRTNGVHRMSLRTDGNLNMVNPATGFWIDGNRVLWHNNNVRSIYVGVGAGNPASTADHNTFVGNNAGSLITSGDNNTFVGTFSGRFNSSVLENSCFDASETLHTFSLGAEQKDFFAWVQNECVYLR